MFLDLSEELRKAMIIPLKIKRKILKEDMSKDVTHISGLGNSMYERRKYTCDE